MHLEDTQGFFFAFEMMSKNPLTACVQNNMFMLEIAERIS